LGDVVVVIKELVVGLIMTNCFIVGCEKSHEAIVIDPGGDVDKILDATYKSNLNIKYIVNTHGHFDHAGGNKAIKEATGAEILIHRFDAPMLRQISMTAMAMGIVLEDSPPADLTVDEGDEIRFGKIALRVIHTPGHSPGGISLYTDGIVFAGDTLFYGSIGRTDLPGSSFPTLISSIKEKLFPLGDHVRVYSGHGPTTTIGTEKRINPFMA
jgi:glyoxylase-like metal-dependent hydrolase (beta-lactamase superfamily II)